jgi:hypothetical protein
VGSGINPWERLVKLLYSILKLVVEHARTPDELSNHLQKFVDEPSRRRMHRDEWECALPEYGDLIMMVLEPFYGYDQDPFALASPFRRHHTRLMQVALVCFTNTGYEVHEADPITPDGWTPVVGTLGAILSARYGAHAEAELNERRTMSNGYGSGTWLRACLGEGTNDEVSATDIDFSVRTRKALYKKHGEALGEVLWLNIREAAFLTIASRILKKPEYDFSDLLAEMRLGNPPVDFQGHTIRFLGAF